MKKSLLVIAILVALIYGCQEAAPYVSTLLGTSQLSSQVVTIDVTKDTIVHTNKGAQIRISKGSIEAGSGTMVQLEIKEAYSLQDIIKGGLSTSSNGLPLSSGGMLYINTVAGSTARIVNPLTIVTPTLYIQPGMQLYKGAIQKDSTINWIDPKPLTANKQQDQLELGKKLYLNNCTSCHRIEKDLTGPALAHAVKRLGGRKFRTDTGYVSALYAFTRDNARVLASGDAYYNFLYNGWAKTQMPLYPLLTTYELDALYAYIENESDRLNLPMPVDDCLDSCLAYYKAKGDVASYKKLKEGDSLTLLNDRDYMSVVINPDDNTLTDSIQWPTTVEPLNRDPLYYEFEIAAFGWYNIDILTKDIGAQPSTLLAHVKEGDYKNISVYLIIPSIKGFFLAYPVEGKPNTYDFYGDDGNIPLPQNVTAYLVALGENGNEIVYADTSFTISAKQEFTLSPGVISKEAFNKKIRDLNLRDGQTTVIVEQKADTLPPTAPQAPKGADVLLPKNCNCDWRGQIQK